MEDIKLYDIDSTEFNELIDTARVELKNNNSEYKKLRNKVNEIMDNFPKSDEIKRRRMQKVTRISITLFANESI